MCLVLPFSLAAGDFSLDLITQMGKAGRWIRNILVGKRVKKYNDETFPIECLNTKSRSQPGTSKVKQRWPLGKAANKEASQKFSISLDSIDTNKLEKCKKNDLSFSAECMATKSTSQPGTPRMKRRWSLGKVAANNHKVSKSLDSIDTTKLPMQAMAEDEGRQNHANAESMVQQNWAMAMAVKDAENAAATKIQAVFRSYLVSASTHNLYIFNSNNIASA